MYGSDRAFLESVTAMAGPVVAVLPQDGPLVTALRSRGIPTRILDFPVLRKVELRTPRAAATFLLRFLRSIPYLASFLRRQGADVVYVSTTIAPMWVFAGRLAKCRVHCHVHEHEPAMSRPVSVALLFPLRAAHGVIANSVATRRWLARSTSRATATRKRVVYNAVREHGPTKIPPSISPARSLVVVGRLSDRKGQDLAIKATALLRDRGYDVRLTIVGDCFPGYEDVVARLERLVCDLELVDRVSFVGFQDPYPYLAAADVVVVPSRVESFGLVAAEALLLGRPTVATRVGGLPEVITDGETGRLVEPGDAAAVADAIGGLLDDPEVAAEMGRNGQVDARRRFSADRFTIQLRGALAGSEVPS